MGGLNIVFAVISAPIRKPYGNILLFFLEYFQYPCFYLPFK